jgi:hypothetical protein
MKAIEIKFNDKNTPKLLHFIYECIEDGRLSTHDAEDMLKEFSQLIVTIVEEGHEKILVQNKGTSH